MHSVRTSWALSSQKDSELLGENSKRIVFNLSAKTDAFKYGLCNGLYLILPT